MGDNTSIEISASISWTSRLEEYFATTGEKASGMAWVHKKSEAMYSKRKTYIDLPVIIGSGLIAFLNAGSSNLFADPKISSVALGVGSLFLGVLNSIGTYFGWSKRAEGHRISAIHYAKLYRFITIELSLPRPERMSPHDLLKYVKDQYDRLAEISPMVPEIIIHEFQRKFKNEKEISKPEEANGLHKIVVYKDEEEDDEESIKDLPGFMSPTPPKLKAFTGPITPKELPKMTVRIPDAVKKPEPKKTVPKEPEVVQVEDTVVSQSEVTIEIPKANSPHED
jgi:hypothetical protein